MVGDNHDGIRLKLKGKPGYRNKIEQLETEKSLRAHSRFPYAVTAVISFFLGGIFVLVLDPLGGSNPILNRIVSGVTRSAETISGSLREERPVTYLDFDIDIYALQESNPEEIEKFVFFGKMPSDAVLRETQYEQGKFALFESDDFSLKITPANDKEFIQLTEPQELENTFFGLIAREAYRSQQTDYYYLSKTLEYQPFGSCTNTDPIVRIAAPCGANRILDRLDNKFYEVLCIAQTEEGLAECDKIVTSLTRAGVNDNDIQNTNSSETQASFSLPEATPLPSPTQTIDSEENIQGLDDNRNQIIAFTLENPVSNSVNYKFEFRQPDDQSISLNVNSATTTAILEDGNTQTKLTISSISSSERVLMTRLQATEIDLFPFDLYRFEDTGINYYTDPYGIELCEPDESAFYCGLRDVFDKETNVYLQITCTGERINCDKLFESLTYLQTTPE